MTLQELAQMEREYTAIAMGGRRPMVLQGGTESSVSANIYPALQVWASVYPSPVYSIHSHPANTDAEAEFQTDASAEDKKIWERQARQLGQPFVGIVLTKYGYYMQGYNGADTNQAERWLNEYADETMSIAVPNLDCYKGVFDIQTAKENLPYNYKEITSLLGVDGNGEQLQFTPMIGQAQAQAQAQAPEQAAYTGEGIMKW